MKMVTPVTLVALIVTVGYLLFDGGYLSKMTGRHQPTSSHVDETKHATAADVPEQVDQNLNANGPAAEKRLDRFSFGSGMAVFGVAIVIGGILKLLSKLIPTRIIHEKR